MIGVRTSYTWQRPPARIEPNSTGPEAVAAAGAGASINTASLMTDIKVFQTLLEAIKQDDVKKAQEALAEWPSSLQALMAKKTSQGWTALTFAASRCVPSLVKQFIGLGADANHIVRSPKGMTALHLCAATTDATRQAEAMIVANMLLYAGGNPFQEDKKGQTPIDLAISSGNSWLRKALEERALFCGDFMFTQKSLYMKPQQRQHLCLVYPRFPFQAQEHRFEPLYLTGYRDLLQKEPAFRIPLQGARVSVREGDMSALLTLSPGVSVPSKLAHSGGVKTGISITIRPLPGQDLELLESLAFVVAETGGQTTLAATLFDISTLEEETAAGFDSSPGTPHAAGAVVKLPELDRQSAGSTATSASRAETEQERYISFGQLFPDTGSALDTRSSFNSNMDTRSTWDDISFMPDVQLLSRDDLGQAVKQAPPDGAAAASGDRRSEEFEFESPLNSTFSMENYDLDSAWVARPDAVPGSAAAGPKSSQLSAGKGAADLVDVALQSPGSLLSTRGSLIPAALSRLSSLGGSDSNRLSASSSVDNHLSSRDSLQQALSIQQLPSRPRSRRQGADRRPSVDIGDATFEPPKRRISGGPRSTPSQRHAAVHSPSRTPPKRDTKSSTWRANKSSTERATELSTERATKSSTQRALGPMKESLLHGRAAGLGAASSKDSAAPPPSDRAARAAPATPNRAEAPPSRNTRQLRDAGREGGRAAAARSRHSGSPPEIQTSFVRPQKQLRQRTSRQRTAQTAPEQDWASSQGGRQVKPERDNTRNHSSRPTAGGSILRART